MKQWTKGQRAKYFTQKVPQRLMNNKALKFKKYIVCNYI